MPALGLIETRGMTGAIEAADAALKAADVELIQVEFSDPAACVVKLGGEVADVASAVDAGGSAARRVGELIAAHVIPRPHDEISKLVNYEAQMTTVGLDVMGANNKKKDDKPKAKGKS